MSYHPPLRLTYHPDCHRNLVTGSLPPRAAADGPDYRRAMTEMESRDQRRLVSLAANSARWLLLGCPPFRPGPRKPPAPSRSPDTGAGLRPILTRSCWVHFAKPIQESE